MISYSDVVKNITILPDFIDEYQAELNAAKKETSVKGIIEQNISALPGITEHRFNQLQTIESVLNYCNIQHKIIKQKHYKKYLEHYGRALSSRDAEKYSEAEQESIDMELIINEVSLLRNQYLGIIKALEQKSFMLGHVVRLRVVGLEDITI